MEGLDFLRRVIGKNYKDLTDTEQQQVCVYIATGDVAIVDWIIVAVADELK